MPLFVGAQSEGVRGLGVLTALPEVQPSIPEATLAPVTFVPKRPSWKNAFRWLATPVAACLVASSMLLSGCVTSGASVQKVRAPIGVMQQQHVDLDRAKQILEARGDASRLALLLNGVPRAESIGRLLENMEHADQALSILEAKMQDRQGRADLAGLDDIYQVLRILDMETDTKNFATPAIGIFIDERFAVQTENGGRWDEDKNRAFTVSRLGPNASIDILLLCPVSGHAEDVYPDELYRKYTSHRTAPDDKHARMRANAQIYSKNNSQYVYLTDDPTSYAMGRIVVSGIEASGRYVTPVRVHLEGLEPGKTYELRWSPFVGADPNNPVVTHHGFRNGRSFRVIVPQNVAVR